MSDTSYHLLALLPPSNILEAKNYVNESFFFRDGYQGCCKILRFNLQYFTKLPKSLK